MQKKLGIYVHVPFCAQAKCPYCDFYSVVPDESGKKEYIEALKRDIKSQSVGKPLSVDTVYFGGGTPSVLGEGLAEILFEIKRDYSVEKSAEITFEANPKTINYETLRVLRKAGFNRLSLGMQSANEEELEILGRRHSKEDVAEVVADAKRAGFTNISLDLMLCVPKQTKKTMIESIDFAASLGVTHISAYLLIIEEGTRFYKKRNELQLPDDDTQAAMYMAACEELEKRGFKQYEISNFAKDGFYSRHNTRYWNCDEYLGFGPSAHSFYDGKRYFYSRNLKEYIEQPKLQFESDGGSLNEYIMLRLRLADGINEDELKARYNKDFSYFNKKTLENLINAGFIKLDGNRLYLTRRGFLVSNSVIGSLIFD